MSVANTPNTTAPRRTDFVAERSGCNPWGVIRRLVIAKGAEYVKPVQPPHGDDTHKLKAWRGMHSKTGNPNCNPFATIYSQALV